MAGVAQSVEHQVVVLRVAGSIPVACPTKSRCSPAKGGTKADQFISIMEILIFAAIAVFIFFKLFEQFGKIDEEQKKDTIRDFIKEQTKTSASNQDNQPKLVAVPGLGIVMTNEPVFDEGSNQILNELDEKLKNDFVGALSKTNLSPIQFVNGAKSAFEIILSAFALGDLQTLKPLISEKIFLQFEAEIKNRKSLNQTLHIKIISIDEAKITAADVVDKFVKINISFVSKQVNYVVNEKDEVVFGNKTQINTIKDIWTFRKDYTSSDPNWVLVASH